MTKPERMGIWLILLAVTGMTFILWAAANKRTDDLTARLTTIASSTSSPTTTTQPPLLAEVQALRKQVLLLQAHRGLTGPEVRALVETILPEETCLQPPCSVPTTVGGAEPSAGPTTTATTEKRGRR